MYHCSLQVNIYSKTSHLENWLIKITPPARFEYDFQSFNTLSASTLAEGDILICDFSKDSNDLRMIHQHKKEGALLIGCAFPDDLDRITPDDYRLMDDLWISPLREETAAFYFAKVIRVLKLKKDLQLNERYLDGVIESLPDMIWFKDLNGAHLKVNDSFCQTVGKTKHDIQGQHHYTIWDIPQEEYEKGECVCRDTDEIVLRERTRHLFNEKVKSKAGMRQLITYKSPILDDHGEPMGTVGIARDVTDLFNMKTELEIVLEHIPYALLFYDNNGTIVSVNKSFEDYFGIAKQRIVGSAYQEWASSIFSDIKGDSNGNYYEAKIRINNTEKIIKVHKEPVYDVFKSVTGHFCIYSDITQEYQMKEKIIYNANTDYLTSLYNRRYLYETISDNWGINRLCLLYIDIDDFKLINDRYGHKAGDQTLVTIARILSEQFPGQMIFRLGGDEFLVVIIDGPSMDRVEKKAREFMDQIKAGEDFPYSAAGLSASIGIVCDSDPAVDFDELLKRGDSALYQAKQNGKNRYCVWNRC